MASQELTHSDFPLRAPQRPDVDALVIVGELSGDEHAAKMVESAQATRPESNIVALGGPNLKASSADVILDMMSYSVIGIVEALKRYSEFKRLRDEIVNWIVTHRPKVVCFVDYPGLNLRIAQALADRGITAKTGGSTRLLFYISPQVWVWKAKRRFKMAELLDSLGVIFPFEVKSFEDTSLETRFVGHPFLADDYELPTRYDPGGPLLLLPGSRSAAVSRIAPVMFDALEAFLQKRPGSKVVCIYANATLKAALEAMLGERPKINEAVTLVPNDTTVSASCVLTSSGTMSLNCALAGIPGAVVYRVHPVTYLFGKALVKIPYIGIANILLDTPLYPEFIQGAAKPDALSGELLDCLDNQDRIDKTRELSGRLRSILDKPAQGGPGSWLCEFIAKSGSGD